MTHPPDEADGPILEAKARALQLIYDIERHTWPEGTKQARADFLKGLTMACRLLLEYTEEPHWIEVELWRVSEILSAQELIEGDLYDAIQMPELRPQP